MRSLALLVFVLLPAACFGVTIGQIDTFEDGTTQNWIVGLLGMTSPAPPVNIPTGGPAGDDDNFLRLSSLGGAGAGSRLAALNLAQWSGDYLASGVAGIMMNVRNSGATDLYLRLLFEKAVAGPPSDIAFSTEAIFLPAGGDWTSALFPVGLDHLSALAGDVSAALATTTVLRIYHSQAPTFPPTPSVALLDVDNIQAVPEPSALALVGAGFALLALRSYRLRS